MDGKEYLSIVDTLSFSLFGNLQVKPALRLFAISGFILGSYLIAIQLGWVDGPKAPVTGYFADAKTAREDEKVMAMPMCEDAADFKSIVKFDITRAYPPSAVRKRIEGRVKAKLRVDDAGKVRDVMVYENLPAGIFDDAVEREAKKMRYEPAEPSCKNTMREANLWVEFKLEDLP